MSLPPEEECRSWVTETAAKIVKFRISRHHADALTVFAMNGPHSATACDCKASGVLVIPVGDHGYIYKWQHEHLREYNTWWLRELRALSVEEYVRGLIEQDVAKAKSKQDHWIETSYAEDLLKYVFSTPPSPKWVLPGQL